MGDDLEDNEVVCIYPNGFDVGAATYVMGIQVEAAQRLMDRIRRHRAIQKITVRRRK